MLRIFHTNPYTKWSSVLIFVVLLSRLIGNESWKNPNAVISGDVKGYYSYLPALFIHGDLQFSNHEDYVYKNDTKIWFNVTKDDRKYIKFPPGMAIMYSPFFAAAHLSTSFVNAPPNGYSYPYQIALLIGTLFYTILGLYFLSKVLLIHFDDRVTASAVLIIYLATNLFYYSTYDFALTHSYSFALIAMYLFGTVKWLETHRLKYVLLLGVAGGLMIAVRNLDVLFLSFILLYRVQTLANFKARLMLLLKKRKHVLLGLSCILLMLLPQLLYNWYISGSLWMDAYSDEKFFFTDPHLFDSLFSYRNGWLIYSPVMLLSLIGLFFLRKRVPSIFLFVVFMIPIYYYVLASWWCWWFVGLGNRGYINLYPILAFALGAFLTYLFEQNRFKRFLVNLFILAAIVLNWFQSYQLSLGVLHWDGMNKDLYWHVFGREERSESQDLLVQSPVMEDSKKGIESVYVSKIDTLSSSYFSFEKITGIAYSSYRKSTRSHSVRYAKFVPENVEYSDPTTFDVPKGTTHISIKTWVKGDAESFIAIQTESPRPFFHYSDEIIETDGDWRRIEILATPFQDVNYKNMEFVLWNKGLHPTHFDDIHVRCLRVSQKKVKL